jgi:hypothetical protein
MFGGGKVTGMHSQGAFVVVDRESNIKTRTRRTQAHAAAAAKQVD